MKKFLTASLLVMAALAVNVCSVAAENDYSKEPDTQSTISFKPTTFECKSELTWHDDFIYIHTLTFTQGDSVLTLQLWSVADDIRAGEYDISPRIDGIYGSPETITASEGYDTWYEEETLSHLKIGQSTYYYLKSGKVSITPTEKGGKMTLSATSAKGSTINVEYEGAISRFSTAYEPAKQDTIVIAADTATYEQYDNGWNIYLLEGEEYAVSLQLITAAEQFNGTYDINASGSENTAKASRGFDGENDEPSFVLHDIGGKIIPYYLASGSVSIENASEEGLYQVSVEATSAHGTVIIITYSGTIEQLDETPWSYEYEPNKRSQPLFIAPDNAYYFGGENSIILTLNQGELYEASIEFITSSEQLPIGEFEINFSLQDSTVKASKGGTSAYDDRSYLWVNSEETGYYLCSYFLVSGKVFVSWSGKNYTIRVDAVSYNGTVIRIAYTGQVKNYFDEGKFNYDAEPQEATDINIIADELSFEQDEGCLITVLRNDDYVAKIAVVTDELQPQDYIVTDTKESNTIKASEGGNEEIDDYSFLWKLDNRGYVQTSWYIVEGEMKVTGNADNYSIVFNAKTYNGSEVSITYNLSDKLQEIDASDFIRQNNGYTEIASKEGELVMIYTLSGQILYHSVANGTTQVLLPENQTIIIRSGNRIAKINI